MNIPIPKINKALLQAIEFLNENGTRGYENFEWPDYAGLPTSISTKLFTDDVDYIQEHWGKLKLKNTKRSRDQCPINVIAKETLPPEISESLRRTRIIETNVGTYINEIY